MSQGPTDRQLYQGLRSLYSAGRNRLVAWIFRQVLGADIIGPYKPYLHLPGLNPLQRLHLIRRLHLIHANINCKHTQYQMAETMLSILEVPRTIKGCIVEAGVFKGGGTAKFSILGKMVGREVFAFDSFEGIPPNNEIDGYNLTTGKSYSFPEGSYLGELDEVKDNIVKYGELSACHLVKGWFDDTMPGFSEKIAVAFVDVDLASSTRTCVRYLYPLLIPGGSIFSHDGHRSLVVEILEDDTFWENEVGCPKPPIPRLGKSKMIKIPKPKGDGTVYGGLT